MPQVLDEKWLIGQASDDESRNWITRTLQTRRRVMESNEFPVDQDLFTMNLGNLQLWFRESSAFSSIETYAEIFCNDNHFLFPGFTGEDARVVLDLGANEGFYTLRMKQNSPECRIVCVEPNPVVFEILKMNISTNRIENASLINKAVGAADGSTPFQFIREIGAIGARDLRSFERPWMREKFISTITTPVVTLESLITQNDIDHVDILKIDVEGMEMDILQGSTNILHLVDRIVVERHSTQLRHQLVGLLEKNGFSLVFEEDPEFNRYYGDLYFIGGGSYTKGTN